MTESRTRPARPGALASAGAIGVAVVLFLASSLVDLLQRADWSWGAFRFFGSGDQLSYLAFVVNVANGHSGNTEPFTETGTTEYPRAYYLLLGQVARLLHADPAVVWSIGGLLVQVVLVIAIGVLCILFTDRAWTGILAALPFLIGVMSVVTGHGWFIQMDSHAVLWGPFAVLFPLNGESFALCVGAVTLLTLLYFAIRVEDRRARLTAALIGSAIIGALANVQTYSFLSVTYIAVYVTAVYGLITFRRRWPIIVSLALVPVLFLVGHLLPFHGNELVTLILGLSPAAPGLLTLVRRSRWYIVVCVAVAGLAASPSVISVLLGIRAHDPFLLYRVASSIDLGVQWWAGILGSLALSVPLVGVFIAGVRRRRPIWIAYPVGAAAAWLLLSSNDLWGASQEPYRLWIDCFMLVAFTLLPVVLTVIQTQLALPSEQDEAPAPLLADSDSAQPIVIDGRERRLSRVGIGIVIVLVLVSMLDWVQFSVSQVETPLIQLSGSRQSAIEAAARPAGNGLLFPDTCIDPLTLKDLTRQRIAFLNVGMAWPAHHTAIMDINNDRGVGKFNVAEAHAGKVGWILTDSTCKWDWPSKYWSVLAKVKTVPYSGGSITLWRFTG